MQTTLAPPKSLQQRLEDGARLLIQHELRGDTGADYQRWLQSWLRLLAQYEAQAA